MTDTFFWYLAALAACLPIFVMIIAVARALEIEMFLRRRYRPGSTLPPQGAHMPADFEKRTEALHD